MRAENLALTLFLTATLTAQDLTAAQDRQRMLDLLHITALRPGVNQSRRTRPSTTTNRRPTPGPTCPIRSPRQRQAGENGKGWWTQRRPQLVKLFDREILGRVPANVPSVRWEVVSTTPGTDGGIATVTKKLIGHVDNSAYAAITVNIEASLTLPANAPKPVPVVLEISFENYPPPNHPPAAPPPRPSSPPGNSRSSRGAGAMPSSIPPPCKPTTEPASPRASSASPTMASRASSTTGAPSAPGPGEPRA